MKLLHILVLAGFLPLAAAAQDEPALGVGPVDAAEATLDEYLWLKRPIVVFADGPNDPAYQRQMQLILRDLPQLEERDVVVITDTDPAAMSSVRQKLRPRGFSLVLMDKDLRPMVRKPLPWDVREITAAIDKLPLRRQEMLEQRPAGR
jgi:hypothetical protein